MPDLGENVWRIESARLTVFFGSAIQLGASESWFESALGVTPEKSEIRRSEGVRVDTGVHEGERVTLQVQLGRADWVFTPQEGALDFAGAELGPIERLQPALGRLSAWIESLDGIVRIAVGCVFRAPSMDKRTSYTLLQSKLHHLTLDPESSEFSYRINRPRKVQLAGEEILVNRISSWSAIVVQHFAQQFGTQAPTQPVVQSVAHWARCEVDISTDAERSSPMSVGLRKAVFELLPAIALEFVNDGDR